MADVVDALNFSVLHLGVATLVVVFSIFIYYKCFYCRGGSEGSTKSVQKKTKKSERKSPQPTPKTPKAPAKPQPQPQKAATQNRSLKNKESDAPKEQVLAITDEEDWVKVKSAKSPKTQTSKSAKSQKLDNQSKKNQQQSKKTDKSSKKGEKVERKSSSDNSPVPSYFIPPPIGKPTEEEWQEITSKKKKPRARKE